MRRNFKDVLMFYITTNHILLWGTEQKSSTINLKHYKDMEYL